VKAAYVDTSCLVGIALAEPGHESLGTSLDRFDQLSSSNLLEAEFRAALSRHGVADDGLITGGLSWILPDRPLSSEISTVLAVGQLRGAGLWHLACALYLSPDPRAITFATLDQRQSAVAAAIGFSVIVAGAATD
jgi:hypothetical protein